MIGIILAAGDGTRLKNSTGENHCKALQKINGTKLIEFALGNLADLDIKKVYIVVGKEGELVKGAIGYNYKGLDVSYVHQKEQKGLVNALIEALRNLEYNNDVILQLADEIFINLKIDTIKSFFPASDTAFYCGVTYEDNSQKIKSNFSVETDENNALVSCIEKPKHVKNNIKGTGFCIFRTSALDILREIYNENTNTPNDLCDYMNTLIQKGKAGSVFVVADKEFNINTSDDLKEIISYLGA